MVIWNDLSRDDFCVILLDLVLYGILIVECCSLLLLSVT